MLEAKDEASCSRNPVLSGCLPKMTREPLSVLSVRDSLPCSPFSLRKGEGKVGARAWAEGEVSGNSVSFLTLISNFDTFLAPHHFLRSQGSYQ